MVWGIYTSSIFTRWQHSAIHSDFSSNVVLEKWNRDFSLSLKFRRRPHSTSSHELSVPRTRLSTYGDRAFPVTAVRIWNSLPQRITPTATEHFQSPLYGSGTVFRSVSHLLCHFPFSALA